jgi:hypothetical protein
MPHLSRVFFSLIWKFQDFRTSALALHGSQPLLTGLDLVVKCLPFLRARRDGRRAHLTGLWFPRTQVHKFCESDEEHRV